MTVMSRVERRKKKNNPALAEESVGDSIENADQGLPTRQSVKENRKKKKDSYPLLTTLAVIFFCIPVLVLIGIWYLDIGPSSDDQNDEYEYQENSDRTSQNEPSSTNQDEKGEENLALEDGGESQNEKADPNNQPVQENNAETKESKGDQPNENEANIIRHTVKGKETLYSISMKYYNSRSGEKLIREHNHLAGNEIYNGQVLEIPISGLEY